MIKSHAAEIITLVFMSKRMIPQNFSKVAPAFPSQSFASGLNNAFIATQNTCMVCLNQNWFETAPPALYAWSDDTPNIFFVST